MPGANPYFGPKRSMSPACPLFWPKMAVLVRTSGGRRLEVGQGAVNLTYNAQTVQMDSRDAHQDGFWEWAGSGNWFAMAAGERYIS